MIFGRKTLTSAKLRLRRIDKGFEYAAYAVLVAFVELGGYGPLHQVVLVVVEMVRKGADLDLPKTALRDAIQHIKNAAMVETTGRKTNGPLVHNMGWVVRVWRSGARQLPASQGEMQKPFSRVETQLKSIRLSRPVARCPAKRRV